MWARIEGDMVAEITDADPSGRFHPSLKWVECTDGVLPGATYINGKFGEKAGRSLEELSMNVRHERDRLMRTVYDVGVIAVARSLRLATESADIDALQARLVRLDEYAIALLNIPQQENFPTEIEWPTIP